MKNQLANNKLVIGKIRFRFSARQVSCCLCGKNFYRVVDLKDWSATYKCLDCESKGKLKKECFRK